MLRQKWIYGLCLMSLIVACGQQPATTANIDQEVAKAEAAALANPTPVADTSVKPYQLPKRSDKPDPVLTVADVTLMTTPEQFAQALVAVDPQVRLAAVKALMPSAANLADAPLQRLMNMLDAEQDKTIVVEVANLLGKSCHPAVMMMLLNNLKRQTNTINIQAITVLGDVGGYRAVEGLEQLLTRLEDEQSLAVEQIRTVAQEAKNKIIARNGQPLVCSW